MNKYTLNFKNIETEKKYQKHLEQTQRILALNLITIGYVLTFATKIITSIIDQDYNYFSLKIALLIYAVMQHLFVKWKPQYIRLAFILSNLANQFTNLEKDSITNLEISYLKGSNTMAFNFLIILAGEFPESVIVFTLQTFYRIFSTFGLDSPINLSVLFNCVYVYIACFLYFYYYHKARRSQFILGLVDSCWDIILSKLIQQPYVLLNFNFENLKFRIQKVQNFPFLKGEESSISENINNKVKQYFRETLIQKETLEQFIYQQIKIFQLRAENTFDISVRTQFEKKLIDLEISFFQSKEPTILIKIKKQKVQSKRLAKQYRIRFTTYNKFMIHFLSGLQKKSDSIKIKNIQRKLISITLLDQIINEKYFLRNIDFNLFFSQLESIFPGKSITIINFSARKTLKTVYNLFSLIILQMLENATDNQILVEIKNKSERIKIKIFAAFQSQKISRLIQRIQYPISLIIEQYKVSNKEIDLLLYTEPIAPFGIEIK